MGININFGSSNHAPRNVLDYRNVFVPFPKWGSDYAQPSPHFDATIAVGKSPALDTASANFSKSGVSRCSGMFGISS